MNRYIALKTNFTATPVLLVDSQACQQDIYACAHQRLHAASSLLETLMCLSFHHADTKDITHIVNVLYLLVQDGCDLLEVQQT